MDRVVDAKVEEVEDSSERVEVEMGGDSKVVEEREKNSDEEMNDEQEMPKKEVEEEKRDEVMDEDKDGVGEEDSVEEKHEKSEHVYDKEYWHEKRKGHGENENEREEFGFDDSERTDFENMKADSLNDLKGERQKDVVNTNKF